jgi:hypothetical protein
MSEFNAYDEESLQEVLEKASEGDKIKFIPENQMGTVMYNVVLDENGNKQVEEIGDYLDVLNDETPSPYVQDERIVSDEMKESTVEDLPSTPTTLSTLSDEKTFLDSDAETLSDSSPNTFSTSNTVSSMSTESPLINITNMPEMSRSTSSTISPDDLGM